MSKRIKNIAVTIWFLTFIIGFFAANVVLPDAEFSRSERRRLAAVPAFTWERLLSGDLFEDFDKYSVDQFIFRDFFRGVKAFAGYNLFGRLDYNGIYLMDGSIIKIEYPLNEQAVLNAAKKFNDIYKQYLSGMDVYYSVIPDKNYFAAQKNGYLSMDYKRMVELLQKGIEDINYIDIFDCLSLEDYYRTDIHWSQDRIIDVAGRLLEGMGNPYRPCETQFEAQKLYPFFGSYYGQAAIRVSPDDLTFLTNDLLEQAIVYDFETRSESKVYMPDKFNGMDPYDVFLSGAKALLTVTNPKAASDRELIIFRDSFGSSIAPLLLEGYSRITLVDLRYMATSLLGEYIDFSENTDVLFLYNTIIINNSYMLK